MHQGAQDSWVYRRLDLLQTLGPAAAGSTTPDTYDGGTVFDHVSANTFRVEPGSHNFRGEIGVEKGSSRRILNGGNDKECFHIGDPRVRLVVGGTYELNAFSQI